jgi:nucleoside-diphosphate-sugar epimerase
MTATPNTGTQPPAQRTVLVTGASGVVGTALLPRLNAGGTAVVALVHRHGVSGPSVRSVRGDVTAPRLGLSPRDYESLAGEVDAVVHAAAVTVFKGRDHALQATNVEGTRHVVRFAADAGVPLSHVSTAFLHPTHDSSRPRSAVGYAVSKRSAEDLLRDSGVPHNIVRPSIVVGDSRSGAISMFQGIYQVTEAVLAGTLPLLPFAPHWPLDLVPCDVVADAIAHLVETGATGRELWLTAGERALSMRDAVEVLAEHAAVTGDAFTRPRFVSPDIFDRLIAPAFLDEFPAPVVAAVNQLADLFLDYVAVEEPFESSVGELETRGVLTLPDSRQSLARSLAYWSQATAAAAPPAVAA